MKVEITGGDTLHVRPSEDVEVVIPLWKEEGQRAAVMVAKALQFHHPEEAARILRAIKEVKDAGRS